MAAKAGHPWPCEMAICNHKLSNFQRPVWLSGYIAVFHSHEALGSISGVGFYFLFIQ